MTEEDYFNSIPDLSREIFFNDKSEFEKFIMSIDKELIANRIPIVIRQLAGASKAAVVLKTTIPMVDLSFAKPNDYTILSLSAHIYNWFDEKYGKKLQLGSALKTITKIDNDYYIIEIPITFGKFDLIFEYNSKVESESQINIAKHICDLTEHVANNITRDEIIFSGNQFNKAMLLSQALSELDSLNMITEAKRDLITSAEILVDKIDTHGLSKWYSLQFSEKILKVFIELKNEKIPFTHDLYKLIKQAKSLGLKDTDKYNYHLIQCKPEIRYNSKLVDIEDAFNAHNEAVMLAGYVIRDILAIMSKK